VAGHDPVGTFMEDTIMVSVTEIARTVSNKEGIQPSNPRLRGPIPMPENEGDEDADPGAARLIPRGSH